jgi:hypothetical protein
MMVFDCACYRDISALCFAELVVPATIARLAWQDFTALQAQSIHTDGRV